MPTGYTFKELLTKQWHKDNIGTIFAVNHSGSIFTIQIDGRQMETAAIKDMAAAIQALPDLIAQVKCLIDLLDNPERISEEGLPAAQKADNLLGRIGAL